MGRSVLGRYKPLSGPAGSRRYGSASVGEHLLDRGDVLGAHLGQLLELAHSASGLSAKQVALSRMHAQNLAISGDLETLARAAMSLELLLGLSRIAWHCF